MSDLVFAVSYHEMRDHLLARSEYHKERAAEKQAKLPSLRESLEELKGAMAGSIANTKSSYHLDTNSPIEELERDIRMHKQKSHTFQFLAEHLSPVNHKLTEAELQRFEFIGRD